MRIILLYYISPRRTVFPIRYTIIIIIIITINEVYYYIIIIVETLVTTVSIRGIINIYIQYTHNINKYL